MTRLTVVALAVVVTSGLPASRAPALQLPTNPLRAGLQAYQEADFERGATLLAYGLDPAVARVDSLWLVSLEYLADALAQTGRSAIATAWLRWALRHHTPRPLQVDDTNLPPSTVSLLAEAATAVLATAGDDSMVNTSWRWPASPVSPAALGALRLGQNAGLDPTLRARIEVAGLLNFGELAPGHQRLLPPGTYTITLVTASGQRRVAREVLPGVVTELEFKPGPAVPTMLFVRAEPEAAVWIDGELVGVAPPNAPERGQRAFVGGKEVRFVWGYRLSPGEHLLTLARAGYQPFDTTIVAGFQREITITVRLAKAPPPDEPPDQSGAGQTLFACRPLWSAVRSPSGGATLPLGEPG